MPLFEAAPRQFYIYTQNMQRVFFSGYNTISGCVVLDLVEPKKTRGVYIQLLGRATTDWTESRTVTRNGKTETERVHVHDMAPLVDIKVPLWAPPTGAESDFLPPGQYSLPFAIATQGLALPPNFQGPHGKISYVLKATIDRPWKWDHRTFLPITLLPVRDCNDPTFDKLLTRQEEKTMCCCCCASGPIVATARVPAAAWCPGELIPFHVQIENHSNKPMNNVTCALDYTTTFYARGSTNKSSKRVASQTLGRPVPPGGDVNETIFLRVPSCCPTIEREVGRLIEHKYGLQVTVHLPAGSFDLHLRMPVTIGTVPHMNPPLFPEQRSGAVQPPVYNWASPEGITQAATAAAAATAGAAGATPAAQATPYQDAYQDSADPDLSSIQGNDMQYVYFEMPQASAQAAQVAVRAGAAGNERTPLLGSAGATAAVATTATVSSQSSTGASVTVSVSGAGAGLPASMFAAPAAVYDIPPEDR